MDELFKVIQESIQINGFENTANIYSISDSSKVGGKIGWVRKDSLSDQIILNLKDLKNSDYSSPIQINNNFFVFKINEIRKIQVEIDKKKN